VYNIVGGDLWLGGARICWKNEGDMNIDQLVCAPLLSEAVWYVRFN